MEFVVQCAAKKKKEKEKRKKKKNQNVKIMICDLKYSPLSGGELDEKIDTICQ